MLVGSTQVELVVAEQEAEHDHKNLNSEANLTLLVSLPLDSKVRRKI